MALPVTVPHENSRRTALLVMYLNEELALCPFFGKCDGLLIIDSNTNSREFHKISQHTTDAVCDLILKAGVGRLVCGFVAGSEKQKLRAAGVDLRLGSCACAIEDLVAQFSDLPRA